MSNDWSKAEQLIKSGSNLEGHSEVYTRIFYTKSNTVCDAIFCSYIYTCIYIYIIYIYFFIFYFYFILFFAVHFLYDVNIHCLL